MKPIYSIVLFLVLAGSSALSSIHSSGVAENMIEKELNRALVLTLKDKSEGWITPDTIQTYRSNIAIPALRDCAYISYSLPDEKRTGIKSKSMKWQGKGKTIAFRGYADCSMATLWSLSDQRLPISLASLAMLWGIFSLAIAIRRKQEVLVAALPEHTYFKGLMLDENLDTFVDSNHQEIHLTPMQHQLMKLFFSTDYHKLTKEQICASLWPKKEDASDTLYTLIKRLRPILEEQSSLRILSYRGKAYQLVDKDEIA